MNRTVCFMMAALVSLNLFNGPLHAAQPAFEGKTIRIVVGFSAGGRVRYLFPGHCATHEQTYSR